jgi:hypothetical protein
MKLTELLSDISEAEQTLLGKQQVSENLSSFAESLNDKTPMNIMLLKDKQNIWLARDVLKFSR